MQAKRTIWRRGLYRTIQVTLFAKRSSAPASLLDSRRSSHYSSKSILLLWLTGGGKQAGKPLGVHGQMVHFSRYKISKSDPNMPSNLYGNSCPAWKRLTFLDSGISGITSSENLGCRPPTLSVLSLDSGNCIYAAVDYSGWDLQGLEQPVPAMRAQPVCPVSAGGKSGPKSMYECN